MNEQKFNKNHLDAIMSEAQEELRALGRHARQLDRTCPVSGERLTPDGNVWITAGGLGDLVLEGVEAIFEATGHHLPHNLVFTQMSKALAFGSAPFQFGGRWCSREGADQLLKEYGRYRGWLRAAATLPAVRKVLMKGQSSNGVNSPYTRFRLEALIKRFPSPHRLERALWKARARADTMLTAWPGERRFASWTQLARGLIKTGHVGKAAVIAVAEALFGDRYYGFNSYKKARDELARMRTSNYPIEDTSDGVLGRRASEPVWSRHGISVFHLRVEERGRFRLLFLVRQERTGRTYHQKVE